MSQTTQTAEQMSVRQMAGEERQQAHAPNKKTTYRLIGLLRFGFGFTSLLFAI